MSELKKLSDYMPKDNKSYQPDNREKTLLGLRISESYSTIVHASQYAKLDATAMLEFGVKKKDFDETYKKIVTQLC
jgi:hypothetical protein